VTGDSTGDDLSMHSLSYAPTIPNLLHRATDRFGERDYVVTPAQTLTIGDAEYRSRVLAKRLLRSGVGKGTRVGILFPQGPDFVVALLAVTRIGALVIPMSTFHRGPELRRVVAHADVHTFLAPRELLGGHVEDLLEAAWPSLRDTRESTLFIAEAPHLRHIWLCGGSDQGWVTPLPRLVEILDEPSISDELLGEVESAGAPSDPNVLIYTSGATAEPKAVVHTHGAQVRHGWSLAQQYELTPDTRTFTTMPFFWVGGLTVSLLSHLHVGAAVITVERIDSRTMLDAIEQTRPTRLVGWGLVERLMSDPSFADRDLRWLPDLVTPPPTDPRRRHGSLGMTETCGPHTGVAASANQMDLTDHLRGSFGSPLPGVEHRIVDPETSAALADGAEGEICVRGYSLMDGLYKKERADTFDGDGWYRTGDMGYFRDGYLFFTGRSTEMIKTAGANVSPREVELAIEEIPDVRAAFVVGLPDQERGQVVACVVCPQPGRTLDPGGVADQLAARLSSYKVPRRVKVVSYDEAPWLPSGKISKSGIVDLLTD
jgi:acyl-CoA synthetase (AMP-forming)/AMP-acid ligase II